MKVSSVSLLLLPVPFTSGAFAQQLVPTAIQYQQRSSGPEQMEWERVKNSADLQTLNSFQSRYPKGRFARQVAERIARVGWEQLDKNDANAVQEFLSQNWNDSYVRREAAKLSLTLAPSSSDQARLVLVDSDKNRGMVVRVAR
jgi:hypothetical protein